MKHFFLREKVETMDFVLVDYRVSLHIVTITQLWKTYPLPNE